MNTEQEAKLNRLADLLDTIPESQYDQHTWAKHVGPSDSPKILGPIGPYQHGNAVICEINTHCGSSACSLGWATSLWPNDFALLVEIDEENQPIENEASIVAFDDEKEPHIIWPEFEEYDGEGNRLVVEFFGITYDEAEKIFGCEECDEDGNKFTPKMKAQQIRDIIAKHKTV